MSYAYNNHNDYQLDHRNRYAAQVAHNKWQAAQHQQLREINRVKAEYMKQPNGIPNKQQWQDLHVAQAAQIPGEQMNLAHIEKMQAMQNYIANEQTQMQDRMSDQVENQISSKNNSDEMAANLKNKEIAAAERMNSQNANALSSMSNSLTSTVGDVGVSPEQASVPNTNMFNKEGERIGGSKYFKNSLLRS